MALFRVKRLGPHWKANPTGDNAWGTITAGGPKAGLRHPNRRPLRARRTLHNPGKASAGLPCSNTAEPPVPEADRFGAIPYGAFHWPLSRETNGRGAAAGV